MPGLTLLIATLLTGSAQAASTEAQASTPATMQWEVKELSVVKRVMPAYPSEVTGEPGDVACRAVVHISGEGLPTEVDVDGCPLPFAVETEKAVADWRWAAWGSMVERRVTMSVRFPRPTRIDAPDAPPTSDPSLPVALGSQAPLGADTSAIPAYDVTFARSGQTADGGIVCSAKIVRGPSGRAVRARLVACPVDLREAAEEALDDLRSQPARRDLEDAPRQRVQDVQITFRAVDA